MISKNLSRVSLVGCIIVLLMTWVLDRHYNKPPIQSKPNLSIQENPVLMPTVLTPPVLVPSKDPVKELRDEAKRRHLHFSVECDPYMEGRFVAFAWDEKFGLTFPNRGIFIEDGAHPLWVVPGGNTQLDAAKELLDIIDGPPNWEPKRRPPEVKMKGKECPPPITGAWVW